MENFCDQASMAGAAGLVVPDLPLEEADKLSKIALSRNLDLYSSRYKEKESLSILRDLYDIDKMIKTFKYGIDYKFELLILKACSNVRY